MLFAAILSVSAGVGGCRCPISVKAVRMEIAFWQFSNKPPNYASVDDAITFLVILHSTCTGPFSGVSPVLVCWILVLVKHFLWICFVPLVLIRESFRLFCILLLCLDVLRYNLEFEEFSCRFNCRICLHRRQGF